MNRQERRAAARANSDPRKAGGDIAGPGGPDDRNSVILDTSKAVLLDNATACVAHLFRNGFPVDATALMLEGKINGSLARTRILYLMDWAGAADVVAHLLSLAERDGRADEFAKLVGDSEAWT